MLIKKANGQIVEAKQELSVPELVLDAPDADAGLSNAAVIAVTQLASMRRQARAADYSASLTDAKTLKLIVETLITIDAWKKKENAQDVLAQLSQEEIEAKVLKLAERIAPVKK